MNRAFLENTLDKLLLEIALDAIERPAGADAFAYGKAVGLYAGVKLVKQKLLDTLKEEDEKGAAL